MAAFSRFYEVSSLLMFEIEEIANEGGGEPVSTARLQCEPRSRGASHSHRAPDLAPSVEVGWFFRSREAERNPQGCIAECVGGGSGCGLRVPRSAGLLLGRFPFPREKGTEKGT